MNITLTDEQVNTAYSDICRRYPFFHYWMKQINADKSMWWMVSYSKEGTVVSTCSEMACKKIIVLAGAMLDRKALPFRFHSLERKAQSLLMLD
jgi:uncharacterized protein YdeI (YjbR/CyaY-like superfamily)